MESKLDVSNMTTAETAKVMPKGQITLPVKIRKSLGLEPGSSVTLVQHNRAVVIVNSADYAMRIFQEAMSGEAEAAGVRSDADVTKMVTKQRKGK